MFKSHCLIPSLQMTLSVREQADMCNVFQDCSSAVWAFEGDVEKSEAVKTSNETNSFSFCVDVA